MRTRLLVALSSLALFGCPSLSTLQTPRTVPKGKVRQAVGLEFVGVSVEGAGSAVAPQVEYGLRIGVSDNIDIGFKAYFLGLEGGAKFQLVRGGFDLSLAPAASYTSFSVGDEQFSFLYLHLPVLMGIQLGDVGQMGFGPKFMYALAFGTVDSEDGEFAAADGLLGGVFWNILFQIGDVMLIGPEINAYVPFTGNEERDPFAGVIYQGGLVMAFGGLEEEEPVAVYQPYPQQQYQPPAPQPQPQPQPVQPMQPAQPVPVQ
jgi:hypothetical protein